MAKSLGLAITFPTLLSTLSSCQNSFNESVRTSQLPLSPFLKSQLFCVSGLVDVILPESDIIGAAQLNVAQFIEQIVSATMYPSVRIHFDKGAALFVQQLKYHFQLKPQDANFKHYQQLLSLLFPVSKQEQQQIFDLQNTPFNQINKKEVDNYNLYKFLVTTRELTLLGYYTSEFVGENVFNYDPIPDIYQPCINVDDVGNSWAS